MKKAILFFALVLVAVFFACQKDISSAIQPSVGKASFMTVAKAKAWFDEVEPKTVWTKTEKQEHYKPQWHLAVQLNGAVEVPVLLEDKGIMPTINSSNPKQYGATRLLVASLDGSTIDGAIIKYFPTEKFVGNMEEINRDNFRDKKFDGMIKLENFDFTDQKVVLIEDGKLTYFMANSERRPSVRPRDFEICYRDCYVPVTTVTAGGYNYTTYGTTLICGNQYCVTVPTDFNPNTGNTSNATGGGGINNSGASILNTGSAIRANNPPCSRSFTFNVTPAANGGDAKNQGALQAVELSFDLPNPQNLTPAPTFPVTIDFLFYSVSRYAFNYATNDLASTPAIQMQRAFMNAWQNTQSAISTNSVTVSNTAIKNFFLTQMTAAIPRNFGNSSVDCYAVITSSNPNAPTSNTSTTGIPIPVLVPITNTIVAGQPIPPPCQ